MRIWMPTPITPYHFDKNEVNDGMSLHNWDAVMAARSGSLKSWLAETPPIEITMSMVQFTPDFFNRDSFLFVSKKMRAAIAAPPHVVEYFDVVPDRLVHTARAMDYKVMHVFAGEDVIDISKSQYRMLKLGDRDPMPMFDVIALKADFAPKADIFLDETYPALEYCTDALAMRVLSAGCTGVRFVDPCSPKWPKPMRFRTLRGVEESGDFNTVTKTLSTTLIEEIPMLQ